MSKITVFNESIYEKFLNNHDLLYTAAPEEWEKGLPMGNSKLSAVVWGNKKLNVTINRADIWEMRRYQPDENCFNWKTFTERLQQGEKDMSGIFQTNKDFGPVPQQLPVGRFEVSLKGDEWLDYEMKLDLYNAITKGYIATELGSLKWACHVSATRDLIIFDYETFDAEQAMIRFRYSSAPDEFLEEWQRNEHPFRFKGLNRGYDRRSMPQIYQILKDWGYEDPDLYRIDNIEVYRQAIPENGNYAVAHATIALNDNHHILVVSITADDLNGKAEDEAISNIRQYAGRKELALEETEHKEWWHEFYQGSFFSINDTRMEALYWVNIYKLGCVSRIDGQATPMSGLWIPDDTLAPWGNTYIWNTQQEMPFYATYVGNRLNTQLSTYRLLKEHRDEMRHIGEDFFKVQGGEYLVHLTDYRLGCPNYTKDHLQAVSGPWMMQMMWNYYKFSMDKHFLSDEVYDMMKAQFRVLKAIMEPGEDGKLHFPWSMSAEYPPFGGHLLKSDAKRFGPDATSDLAYTKWLAKTLLEAAEVLGINDTEAADWQYVLDNIADYTFDEFGGFQVRADMPLSDSHRHLSHLFAITQTHEVDQETPAGRKLIADSLYALKVAGTGEWMGWTFSETAKMAQMLEDAPLAYSLIHEYCDKIVNENTMDFNGSRDNNAFTYHPGFGLTIDSDGMFNEALQNFAVTSYNDIAYIFMAVPEKLKDISFYHFRTEGAYLVSGQRRNGVNEFITVEPLAGGCFTMVSPMGSNIQIRCEGKTIPFDWNGRKVSFFTEKGREYIITASGKNVDRACVEAVTPKPYEINYFGCKK